MCNLSIISQNLNGYNQKEINDSMYMNKYQADIYAFQELRRKRCSITITKGKDGREIRCDSPEKAIWDAAFPWVEFKSGYFMESEIEFARKQIRLINFHSSSTYSFPVRYTLLRRLEDIQNGSVILLGDFNAAFENQTDRPIKENNKFLNRIKKLGFEELLSDEENEPHHTFECTKKDNTKEKKKLDHIFISNKLYQLSPSEWTFGITYIDDVDSGFPELKAAHKSGKTFIDHSGIKLTITAKTS